MKNGIMNFLKEEKGQGMTEYGLIIGLVAVVLIGALVLLRGGLENIFSSATDALNNPAAAGTTPTP